MLSAGVSGNGTRKQFGGWGAVLYNIAISRSAARWARSQGRWCRSSSGGLRAFCVDSLMHAEGVVGVAASEKVRMAARLCSPKSCGRWKVISGMP